MAMTFRRIASAGCAGVLLLAASGCAVESSSGEREEIASTAEAICDTTYYAGVCQQFCRNTCTDGAAIAACMSACIGGYCAQERFTPHERCRGAAWWPEPARTPPASQPNCESDVYMSCQTRCELCNAPGSTGRGVCLRNCTETWCTAGALGACHEQKRSHCQDRCFLTTPPGEARYFCLASCFSELCPG